MSGLAFNNLAYVNSLLDTIRDVVAAVWLKFPNDAPSKFSG